ncbi:MAG: GGDEF domain-containing protein [Vitreoscilla sp.]|nr:GGDEF domain-containing protein [Vitreoscilla sp.]
MTKWLSHSGKALEQVLSAHPRLRPVAWAGGGATLIALFSIRAVSGAEFAFMSLALLPVIWSAWVTGRAGGRVMALLASATWIAGDLASDREFPSAWVPWLNGLVHAVMYLLVATLAAELQVALQREHDRATRDELTGLLNRRHFLDAGQLEVARAIRHERPLTVLFLDLDHFKQLNDSQGHHSGDEALQAVAQALLRSVRSTDLVARLGGDEFAAMLLEVDQEGSSQAVQRLAETANAAVSGYPSLSVSVGAARFAYPTPPLADMLRAADLLMYRAKQAGRGSLNVEDFPASKRHAA